MRSFFLFLLLGMAINVFGQTQRQKDSIMLVNGGICVFLDFDGQTVTGTDWNFSGTPIFAAPSEINGNQVRIDSVVNLVQQYYKPFNVVVTSDSTLFFLAKIDRRKRIVNTPTNAWYGSSIAGVSYNNSMYWGNGDCSWCFEISSYDAKTRAIINAHEAGHTLGLWHQNQGSIGTGEIGIRPLMNSSASPSANAELWWKGTNQMSAIQSDIDVIYGFDLGKSLDTYHNATGAGVRLGDAGNTFNAAKYIQKNQTFPAFIGVADSDYYKIDIPSTQTVTISVNVWNQGASNANSTLDAAIDLYSNNHTLITSSANTTTLNAVITQSLSAGTYFIKVRPDRSNANNPSGYGFMGSYWINYTY